MYAHQDVSKQNQVQHQPVTSVTKNVYARNTFESDASAILIKQDRCDQISFFHYSGCGILSGLNKLDPILCENYQQTITIVYFEGELSTNYYNNLF